MKVLKRNQIIIFVIALMLVSAGYLNYTAIHNEDEITTSASLNEIHSAAIGDAKLVSSNVIEENTNVMANDISTTNNELIENEQKDKITDTMTNNVENNTIQTSNNPTASEQYFTSSKLNRDKMYSQMIESYQKILENEDISSDQKGIAQTEIKKINDTKNAIMIAENLIKLKDFDDVIILVNEDSVNVIVKAIDLSEEQIAQIQNIISRELKAELTNIHISTKGPQ